MYFVGVDLGGTNTRAGLVSESGKIIAMEGLPTSRTEGYRRIVADMADLVRGIVKGENLNLSDIECIGIGVPGSINRRQGVLIYANNFDFSDAPIAEEMRRHIDLPLYLQNDANCAALGESVAGAAKDVSDSITITLGTGIGGGIVLGGKVFSGFNDAAGELGHTVIVSGGEPCTCGRKGCWEAYASATALIRQTKSAARAHPDSIINRLADGDLRTIDARTAFDAEKAGDSAGAEVVGNYIRYLAEGLTDLVNIFTPELIVIGGGVSNQGENLLGRLRTLVEENIYFKGEPRTRIVRARLGDRAGIVGAAMMGRYEADVSGAG